MGGLPVLSHSPGAWASNYSLTLPLAQKSQESLSEMTRIGRRTGQDTSGEEQQADGVEAFRGGQEISLEREAKARSPQRLRDRGKEPGFIPRAARGTEGLYPGKHMV